MKAVVANVPAQNNIPLVQIETKVGQISDVVELHIAKRFKENFGVTVSGVDISAIELDKSSDGYRQLMSVTKNMDTAKIHAQTEDYIERLRIQREEGQYALHKQTQTANIGAFQIEKQAEVGIAGADALGQMGLNGAGDMNLGGTTEGFNMAAMMASMAVGGAVGQNIAGSMNNMMSRIHQPMQNGITPPPLPNVIYYIAVNGQANGPFEIHTISQMIEVGKVIKTTLVWKQGMKEWAEASSLGEFKDLFENSIPPIPTIRE